MPSPQQATTFGRLGRGVLDGLSFIENGIVKLNLAQVRDVAPQGAIGGQHEVELVQPIAERVAFRAGEVQHPHLGGEPAGLIRPVEYQALGGHDQRGGSFRRMQLLMLAARLEQRQDLHGLAQSHVVRQAAPQLQIAEPMEPAQPQFLIGTQLTAKPRRRRVGGETTKLGQFRAPAGEPLVDSPRVGSRVGQQRIEQQGLTRQEFQGFVIALSQIGQQAEPRAGVAENHLRRQMIYP